MTYFSSGAISVEGRNLRCLMVTFGRNLLQLYLVGSNKVINVKVAKLVTPYHSILLPIISESEKDGFFAHLLVWQKRQNHQ